MKKNKFMCIEARSGKDETKRSRKDETKSRIMINEDIIEEANIFT